MLSRGAETALKAITLVKGDGGTINDDVIEAVQSIIRQCPAVKALRYVNGHTGLDSDELFELAPGIDCCLVFEGNTSTKDTSTSSIRLSTKTKTVQNVQDFIDDCYRKYTLDLQNKLEGKLYVFDQMIPNNGTMRELGLPAMPRLQFNKQQFFTGKSFENIFFDQKELVEARVRFFLERPDWYLKKGVAHTLGILLTGPPGTGKTSLIKAIARETNRHVVNVNMSGVETKQQFADLFYENTVQCKPKDLGERHETLTIPVQNRIIVLEDLDCAGNNITLKREKPTKKSEPDQDQQQQEQQQQPTMKRRVPTGSTSRRRFYEDELDSQDDEPVYNGRSSGFSSRFANAASGGGGGSGSSLAAAYGGGGGMKAELTDEQMKAKRTTITLSDLLNVLDGSVESPGRIIIFTTNHPERIDPALLRPGRVDLQIHFDMASRQVIADLYKCYYDLPFPMEDFDKLPDRVHSPALISSVLLGCFGDPDGARKQLISMQAQMQNDH